MRPLRWASQEPTNVATVSLFAAPRDGEASLWSAYDIAPVGLLGPRERCGNFAIRNPQGRRGLALVSVWHPSAGPPRSPRTWREFRSSQPLPGWRGLILICVWHHSVEPPRNHRSWRQLRSSQPPGAARPHSDLRMTLLRWTPQGPANVATVSQFAAPRNGEASF